MALLPSGLPAQLALATVLVGLALVLRRSVPKAYGLAVIMMGVVFFDILAAFRGAPSVGGELGFRVSAIAQGDGWWTPLTSAFAHADGMHLIGNLFILLTAGPALEARIGERRFLLIFFAAHAAALIVHTLLAATTSIVPYASLALGASGGIFGVLTAFAVRYPREKLPIAIILILWLPASIVLLLYLAFNVAYFLGDWLGGAVGIAWWGHFAGFFVGLAWSARLPAAPTVVEAKGSTRGLPDADKLAPLATTPELKRILDNLRQFTPDARTAHDSTFAMSWVDKFFERATCPQGHRFVRRGLTATCDAGETTIEFSRSG